MRLVTYSLPDNAAQSIGVLVRQGEAEFVLDLPQAFDLAATQPDGGELTAIGFNRPPGTLIELLRSGQASIEALTPLLVLLAIDPTKLEIDQETHAHLGAALAPLTMVDLYAPLPRPNTVRDFYAFEQHVKTARAHRGADMISEWYDIPVFYFSNPEAIYGPEVAVPHPQASQELDYELEMAWVMSKEGRNIPAAEALSYVAGYMVMNDWSARDVQRQEMKMNLGPAKGKDFATSLGPWLATPDELTDRREGEGAATQFNLEMIARVNGKEYSRGNTNSLTHTIAKMIEWASRDVTLKPGDVMGTGTVGTGCILELRPETVGGWLKPGDVVELEIERLGVLRNEIIES